VPLAEDLVLDHLHLVLALPVLLQLAVLPHVLQQNLLYLLPLVLAHHLRQRLRRLPLLRLQLLLCLRTDLLELLTASFVRGLLALDLQSLEVLLPEAREI
jgi:hypothetical protein